MAFYTDDFEGTADGNKPSHWEQNTTNTTGHIEADSARSHKNSQSLLSNEPDSGSGSDVDAGTNNFSPNGDCNLTFYLNFDKDNLDNSYSAIDIYNADTYNLSNVSIYSWRVRFDHGGTKDIVALDGDGSGGGSWVTLVSGFSHDYWYKIRIKAFYGSDEYYVYIDGTEYGPFGFYNSCSPSDVPYFAHRNSNVRYHIDAVSATYLVGSVISTSGGIIQSKNGILQTKP